MKTEIKRTEIRSKRGAFAIVIFLLCFIWGNSLLPGAESGQISGGLLAWLKENFRFLSGLPEVALRKIGHLSEFAALGVCLSPLFCSAGAAGFHRVTMPLFVGMSVANVDETIQYFRPGRGSSVIDVWIDVGGVCIGICLWLILHKMIKQKGE